ncbi:MAG: ice-binding family protein [Solirubrobacterales bacterium]
MTAVAWLASFAFVANEARSAQPPVGLGTVNAFAVLAGSTVTNTGPSVINGDLGLFPGTSVTGFPPGILNGALHATDAVAGQAQSDLSTAYNDAAGRIPAASVPADLGGLSVSPGVFRNASSLLLTGSLNLNAQGNPNAVFIFQAGSSLTTATGSRVNLVNGAQACNVFWQIGSSATLGTGSTFVGNILALTSTSLNDSVTVNGRVLARNGAVTLINDTVTASGCAPGTTQNDGSGGPPPGTSADDGSALLTTNPGGIARDISRGSDRCVDRVFKAAVRGLFIRQVVFSVGNRTVATDTRSPYEASVRRYNGGSHVVRARVTFTDGTAAVTLRMRFRACAAASSQAPREPVGFTG